ncbi:ABC transporter substrate-binding protein [Aestuariispira insulae]|uniref:Probable sugar-binding periplasmic protein n=1 Tax=Aestuariispira insulae TaxID=1461337 RepID=A0A3D9HRV7_9PROT|nr:ABC transporter substrate-binding protein [Aestuariispira insulae]RED51596.1 carbohydrate ABC transporter substrate-binding protein (CUT1 family) [Aestuariispira insulae]
MMKKLISTTALTGVVVGLGMSAAVADASLTIESWRNDDADIWNEKIIPAFNKVHPDIKVTFAPTPPADYNAGLNAKLAGGTAGDLITCRPFDASLDLYNKGHLTDLGSLDGMDNFSDVAKSAWQTDDGKATFCLPMASVIHGFIYNKEIFEEVGIDVPKTIPEFMDAVKKIKDETRYVPIAMGTADQWEAATMGYQNVGPNFWKGEEGRKAVIDGKEKLSDDAYVKTFEHLAQWKDYMGNGYKAQKYPDTQNLFTLGRAAIYPAGSWDITTFNSQADFKFGAFPPPVPANGDECYISDHTDIALGINAASPNKEAAEKFLSWMATSEFAEIYSNSLPGFFSLSNHKVEVQDPVAQEFVSWRDSCKSTIRNSYQILSRGTPNLENELWNVSAQVLNGTMSPEDAAAKTQDGLAKWYKPQM